MCEKPKSQNTERVIGKFSIIKELTAIELLVMLRECRKYPEDVHWVKEIELELKKRETKERRHK